MDASLASSEMQSSRVAVLKVDIKSWGTPVCQQFGISSVPHMMFYDPSGKKLTEGPRAYHEFQVKLRKH